jgi:tetratricopeptide (TPR) repeat protein
VSCSRSLLLLPILAIAILPGCRRVEPGGGRIAILRFENLGDPAADWMGRALSEAMSASLAPERAIRTETLRGFDPALGARPTAAPGVSSERTQALLAGADRIGYGRYSVRDGKVSVQLTIQTTQGNRTLRSLGATAEETRLLALAEGLARQVGPKATSCGTSSLAAARAYAMALETRVPDDAVALLEQAAAADPAYGAAQQLLARSRLARQDRAGAEAVLRQALSHSAAMSAEWRARLEYDLAGLRGDGAGRARALAALAQATPEDPAVWRAAGNVAQARNQTAAAIAAYRKALAIDPNDVGVLNELGYSLSASGDLKGAVEAISRYRTLRPNDANPLDSLGDVHFQSGRFAEAAQHYSEAYAKDPRFLNGGTLYKAALARLLSGDVAAADALIKPHIDALQAAGDPTVEYRKADWSWISGRRKEGLERLLRWAGAPPPTASKDLAARAWSQLAVWSLALGNRENARLAAARAAQLAGPASAGIVSMIAFLTQPPASSSEWAVRAERAFPEAAQAPLRGFARAYALLLAKDYADAALVLKEMHVASGGAGDQSIPVLLGWAYLMSGKTAEAAPLLARFPLPSPEGPAPFMVMHWPRVLYLRGLLAEKQGRMEAARGEYRTFLRLSGSEPLLWGEEAEAAARLR